MSDLVAHARLNRAWWILPVAAGLLFAVLAGSATQSVVPYAVYTLF